MALVGVLCVLRRKRRWTTSLAFVSSLDESYLGSTFLHQRCQSCHGGMEKKNEEEFGWWYLEDGSLGNLVVYMKGKE